MADDYEKPAPKYERRSMVRFPVTLFVDQVEFEPEVYAGTVVRTAYDLDLTFYDAKKLYEELKTRIEKAPNVPVRIRVIGRLA